MLLFTIRLFKKIMGFVLNHPTFSFFFYKLSVSLCQEGRTIALYACISDWAITARVKQCCPNDKALLYRAPFHHIKLISLSLLVCLFNCLP